MNSNPWSTVEYVGIAVLAVLGNHFLGLPDAQTTALVVGGILTALGIVKLNGLATLSTNTAALAANTAATQQNTLATLDNSTFQSPTSSSPGSTSAVPNASDTPTATVTRVGRQDVP